MVKNGRVCFLFRVLTCKIFHLVNFHFHNFFHFSCEISQKFRRNFISLVKSPKYRPIWAYIRVRPKNWHEKWKILTWKSPKVQHILTNFMKKIDMWKWKVEIIGEIWGQKFEMGREWGGVEEGCVCECNFWHVIAILTKWRHSWFALELKNTKHNPVVQGIS